MILEGILHSKRQKSHLYLFGEDIKFQKKIYCAEGIFFNGGQTDADGASGAINGMKRWSVTPDRHTHGRTDVKVEIVV